MVTHAGDVFDAAAPRQHDGVFLKVMAFARDVRIDFDMVGQPDARDLSQRRVGFLGGRGKHADAYATTLRAVLERTRLTFTGKRFSPVPDQLTDS
jgi:hypothetical protein